MKNSEINKSTIDLLKTNHLSKIDFVLLVADVDVLSKIKFVLLVVVIFVLSKIEFVPL